MTIAIVWLFCGCVILLIANDYIKHEISQRPLRIATRLVLLFLWPLVLIGELVVISVKGLLE